MCSSVKFTDKLRLALQRFMVGRTGLDHLGIALLYGGIVLNLLSLLPYLQVLHLLALAAFGYALFRMFSRNTAKRAQENRWWLEKSGPVTTKARQAMVRFKNRKQYRYFKCPQCHAMLKLPRNVGEVTVTCGSCKHAFKKKA